jgi:pyruvate dehydrogenase E1 component alpha subunit
MDVADTQAAVAEAVEICRAEQRPLLVEAMTYRFRGHSMSDPERYRSREQVSKWKEQDPIPAFTARLYAEGKVTEAEVEEMDANAIAVADAAAAAADEAPFPTPESLYDNVYSLGGQVRGWLSNRNPAD